MAARIELGSDLGEVARLNDWLSGVLAGVPDATVQAAKLCLNELVANVILYGYPDGREGRIDVAVEPRGAAVAVSIEDDGMPFDPLAGPLAKAMTGLEDAQVGGFGIKLFRESAHSATYARSGGRNRLSFVCG